MIKYTWFFGLLIFSLTTNGQTSRYAGIYNYKIGGAKGGFGSIVIYPETDTTVLFYIDLHKGKPSFNMGSLYGRVMVINEKGTFKTKFEQEDKGCEWSFDFAKNSLSIKTIFGSANCGFGNAVYADGKFKKRSNRIVQYFENMEGDKVYFSKTKPEDYYMN